MPVIIDAPARVGLIELFGKPATVYGTDVAVGDVAPAFTVTGDGWKTVAPLVEAQGKIILLISVPSLNTDVCDRETRRFNEEATKLSDEIVMYVISTDFPFVQKRWCGAAGVERVHLASDVLETDFGLKYGLLVKERRYLRRAVFVIDRAGIVRYVEYTSGIPVEPNYDAVIAAAKELV